MTERPKFKFALAETLLGLAVAGLFVLAVVLIAERLKPPPVVFSAYVVTDSPPMMIAEAKRRNIDGCSNGIQAEIRDHSGSVTRLPVPARTISGAFSRYPLVIPADVPRGSYQVHIRETVLCSGEALETIDTPWLPLKVVK